MKTVNYHISSTNGSHTLAYDGKNICTRYYFRLAIEVFLKTSWMGLPSPSDHWIYNFYFPYPGIFCKGKQWDHKVRENFKNMWLCLVSLGRKIKCEPPPEARYQASSRGKAALSAEMALSCQGCVPAGEDKKSLDRQADWQFGRR